MQFKEFITRQRGIILVFGIITFVVTLTIAQIHGYDSLTGALFIDLAASSLTIVFTAFIIDYLNVREQHDKTHNVASLAEDEIRATCFRTKWRMARLFGLERHPTNRDDIRNQEEARQYLQAMTRDVDDFLAQVDFQSDIPIDEAAFMRYVERLQTAQNELEQTLILYEYAMSYSLREHVLALRSELQIADRVLGFIDTNEGLNEANRSLIMVTAESIFDAIEAVLGHDSRAVAGVPIHAKNTHRPT